MPGFDPRFPPNGGAPPMGAPDPFADQSEPPYDPQQDPVAARLQNMTPLDLNLDLGFEKELMLAHHVCQEIDAYVAATDRRRSTPNVWRLAWEMMPPGTANRWQNSSDIPSALSRIIGNSHHTKLNQQTNATDPPFTAIAEEPFGQDPGTED